MPFILRRTWQNRKGYAFYMGLGKRKGSHFANPTWDDGEAVPAEAVRYEDESEAVEAAKTLFPNLLTRGVVEPVEVTK